MENHLQNHLKGQICPVLTVGWPMLPDFVVEGCKSDFCDSSRVKIGFFPFLFTSMSSLGRGKSCSVRDHMTMTPGFCTKQLLMLTMLLWGPGMLGV